MSSNEYQVFTWGPHLYKGRLPKSTMDELAIRINNSHEFCNSTLASDIKDVRSLTQEDCNWLSMSLSESISNYFGSIGNRSATNASVHVPNYNGIVLSSAWVNRQKPNEANPQHCHSGDISFSTYVSIPDELKKEQSEYAGNSIGPGGVVFKYGESNKFNAHVASFTPEEGDIFMFPSYLYHWVIPFKSDCTRISVAGNFVLY